MGSIEIQPTPLTPANGKVAATERPKATALVTPRDEDMEVTRNEMLVSNEPPVDTERVEQIRKAIADGTYPLVPAKIADAMIAARIMLRKSK